jgi:hypothetical protein
MSIRNHFIAISSKNFNLRFYLATFGSVYSDSVYPWELLSVSSERLPTTNNYRFPQGTPNLCAHERQSRRLSF